MSSSPASTRATSSASMPAACRSNCLPFSASASQNFNSIIPWHPDFVSQIAGVAGAGDVDGNAGNFAAGDAEIFQIRDIGFGDGLQQLGRRGSLQSERGDFLGNILDLNIHVQAVLAEPAQAGIGGGPAIDVFFETRNGAVVDDLALFIAPAAINDLAHFDFVDIARDNAVHEACRVLAGDQILVKRRDVDERGRVANGVVLVLMMHFIHADGVVARPLAIVQAVAKGESSLVKCGSDGQRVPRLQQFFFVSSTNNRQTLAHT